jgi:sugar lactone lactonase YvrE
LDTRWSGVLQASRVVFCLSVSILCLSSASAASAQEFSYISALSGRGGPQGQVVFALAFDQQRNALVGGRDAGSTGNGVPDVLLARAESIANHLKAGRPSAGTKVAPFATASTNPIPATASITLGTNSLTFGRGSGTGTVVIGATSGWTASTTAAWLHISTPAGTGSALFEFTYDANSGATRTETISFNDGAATLTIRQAEESYVAATEVTTLTSPALSASAADAAGNVYFTESDTLQKWTAETGQVNTLISFGLPLPPKGVALDRRGNVYFPDIFNGAIKEWIAGTREVVTLASGLNAPSYVALDATGNVYFSDTANNAIKKWTAATHDVTTLVSSGLSGPQGVAVDAAANVYIADIGHNLIKKWIAATGQVTTLLSSSSGLILTDRGNLAVDKAGNLYIIDYDSGLNAVKEWIAATGQLTTLMEGTSEFFPYGVAVDPAGKLFVTYNEPNILGLIEPQVGAILGTTVSTPLNAVGVAVDGLGNVFFTNTNTNALGEHSPGFYKWTAGTGQFTQSLFEITSSPTSAVAVDRDENLYIGFSDNEVLEWPQSGSHLIEIAPVTGVPLFPPNPSGLAVDASGNVYFDSNNALQKWTAATGETSTLASSPFGPGGMALDAAGNVYAVNETAIEKWTARTGQLTTLLSVPLVHFPNAVAVDGAGDVYFDKDDLIEKWNAASGAVSIVAAPIITPPFFQYSPDGVSGALSLAVDAIGNLYLANRSAIQKITRAFIDPDAIAEPLTAGSDQLPQVLPVGTPLDALSDQPWLTITSQDNGVVKFSFTATTVPRTAHISLLGRTIQVTQANDNVPTVVSWSVQWGSETYSLTGSTRNRLPWQIDSIRAVFSKPIASGDTGSLSGVTATSLNDLGTNTLTWTIDPVFLGSFTLALATSGPNALRDAAGNPLAGNSTQILKVLWGDYNDDGVVNASDLAGVKFFTQFAYTPFADMNGDGIVGATDIQIVRTQIGNTLP